MRLRALFFLPLTILAHFVCRYWLAAFSLGGLLGCASSTSPLPVLLSNVIFDKFAASGVDKIPANPDPKFRYLRVEVEGYPPALLVLAFLDAHPLGEIEVWYSANQEVIRTQNGRIVGTAGLLVDWRAVHFKSSPPAWTQVAPRSVLYERLRDQMPGYRYGVLDRMEIKPWQGVPAIALPSVVGVERARSWDWFREATLDSSGPALPPAWFAWGKHRGEPNVVYSEQCLAAEFCLKLLRWPVREGAL